MKADVKKHIQLPEKSEQLFPLLFVAGGWADVKKHIRLLDKILFFLFSGHEPIYFIENKEKTLRASYDRGTQIVDYMD